MPRKIKSKEEILEQAKLNRRKRYEKIKSDPVLYAKEKEKEHQRYLKRKEQKKILSINEMTPRARKQQRKNWRENFKRHYQNKRLRNRGLELMKDNTPSSSDNEDHHEEGRIQADPNEGRNHPPEQYSNLQPLQLLSYEPQETSIVVELKKKIRRLRYIILQNSKVFKSKAKSLEQKVESYKKAMVRLKKRLQSPNSKVNEMLKDKSKLPEAKRKILFGEAMKKTLEENYKRQSKKEKKYFSNAVIGDKSVLKSHKILSEIKKFSVREKTLNEKKVDHYVNIKQNIQNFFERDDISRITSGKKEIITKNQIQKQRRYLLDSLKNLHKIFEEQYCKVSYSFFCKLRPFWVLIPNYNERDTCVCKTHANMEFLVRTLNKRKILSEKTPNDVINSLCCNKTECLLNRCDKCRNKVLNYLEFNNEEVIKFKRWESKKSTYISKGVEKEKRIIEKIEVTSSPKEAIEELQKSINGFLNHEGTRRWQFSALNDLKNNLKDNEVIIHIDFSENYALKYETEVQSFHFGGSRGELTLHTAVIYLSETGKCTPRSFCTVSENLRHDAAAVWAHLIPLLEFIQSIKKSITTLHFLSDSPSSQYRNKTIFYIITKLYWYFAGLSQITWNYSEAGHGKGAADGVGGTLKRTADSAVAHGKDVATLESFVKIVKSNIQNITVVIVDDYQIYEKDLLIPNEDLLPLKGTLKVHQVLWHKEKGSLIFRQASCFTCVNGNDCPHTKLVGKLKYPKTDDVSNKENNSDCVNSAFSSIVKPSKILIQRPISSSNNTAPSISEIPFKTSRSKVEIKSDILLQPAMKGYVEVTRLSDIVPDSKMHLNPEVDINDMVNEYNISTISENFSACFYDFVKTTTNSKQNIEPMCLKNNYPPQTSLVMDDTPKPLNDELEMDASRSVEKYETNIISSSDDEYSLDSLIKHRPHKVSQDGPEPKPCGSRENDMDIIENSYEEGLFIIKSSFLKGPSGTLLEKRKQTELSRKRRLSYSSSDSDLDFFSVKRKYFK